MSATGADSSTMASIMGVVNSAYVACMRCFFGGHFRLDFLVVVCQSLCRAEPVDSTKKV